MAATPSAWWVHHAVVIGMGVVHPKRGVGHVVGFNIERDGVDVEFNGGSTHCYQERSWGQFAAVTLNHVEVHTGPKDDVHTPIIDPLERIPGVLRAIFNDIDRDGGGSISTPELCAYLRRKAKKGFLTDIAGNLQQQMQLSRALDEDGDGEVVLTEFLHGMAMCTNKELRKYIFYRAYPETEYQEQYDVSENPDTHAVDPALEVLHHRVAELELELAEMVAQNAPLQAHATALEIEVDATQRQLAARRAMVKSMTKEVDANKLARLAHVSADASTDAVILEAELRQKVRLKVSEAKAYERHLRKTQGELAELEEVDLRPQLEAADEAGKALLKANAGRLILHCIKKRRRRRLRRRLNELEHERHELLDAEAEKRKREITVALRRDRDNFERLETRLAHTRATLMEATRRATAATHDGREVRAELSRERAMTAKTEATIDAMRTEVRKLQVQLRGRNARLVALRHEFQGKVSREIVTLSDGLIQTALQRQWEKANTHEVAMRVEIIARTAGNKRARDSLLRSKEAVASERTTAILT
jgi:hypothetical protein